MIHGIVTFLVNTYIGASMKKVLIAFTFVCLNFGFAQAATPIQRDSLRYLPGVAVIIEEVPADAKADGLSEDLIRAAADRSLQSSRVTVLTPAEQANTPSKPSLYVRVSTYRIRSGLYAYAVTVALKQSVVLAHRPQRTMVATTWEEGVIGTPGPNNLHQATKAVEDLVTVFVRDFQAANNQDAVREE